ncbi:helix-turn-helix domain-containing protein, partial [bacterium]|nr:helix-turn-helix domain-containing protein [bacterium]
MIPLHEELRALRMKKGVTLEHIYDVMKISVSILRKIEDGDFSVVPQPFLRAFLREYAQVIGIDPERVILRYENRIQSIIEPKPPVQPVIEETPPKPPKKESKRREKQSEIIIPERKDEPPVEEQGEPVPVISAESPATEEKTGEPTLFDLSSEAAVEKTVPDEKISRTETETPKQAEPEIIENETVPAPRQLRSETHKRLEIEEPSQTNTVYFVVFVVIII